ncbi:CPCC family cysteine-rich protein [Pseudomonas sp. W2Aug9]|nr:CPCC family cysteine-rich protein [Pseudomonas sp. W2Aug9]
MFTCPCCGYAVFEEHPGSYDICPICFWRMTCSNSITLTRWMDRIDVA